MLREKSAQGMPITVIVAAIIGLIIIVVLVALLTGRLNIFSSGANELTTCENTCKNIGYDGSSALPKGNCKRVIGDSGRVIHGIFGDVGEGKECCCLIIT